MDIPNEKLIEMYTTMVRIRAFEERASKEYAAGNLPGMMHVYIGEEAVATGACANLNPDDYITSTHRGHGHLIAKGGKPDRMMAELFGKKTGYNKGKGGSMHIADMEIGILGANGIVGAGIPIAGGAALAAKMKGTKQVAVCFLGDGATNTSRFHEGVNLASIWKLPVVYIIENNQFAESTCISYSCNVPDIAARAGSYGIPGKIVDGNDVLEVYETVHEAVANAREGKGPTMIECKTWRQHGHFEGDAQTYKTKEDIESWTKKDPVDRYKKKLIQMNVLTKESAEKIDNAINEEIENAIKFAVESPLPAPEEALEDVFA